MINSCFVLPFPFLFLSYTINEGTPTTRLFACLLYTLKRDFWHKFHHIRITCFVFYFFFVVCLFCVVCILVASSPTNALTRSSALFLLVKIFFVLILSLALSLSLPRGPREVTWRICFVGDFKKVSLKMVF